MLKVETARFEISSSTMERSRQALKRIMTEFPKGFVSIPGNDEMWAHAEQMGQEIRRRFKKLVVCGIGGSSLGGRVVAAVSGSGNVEFLENVDGAHFDRVLARIDLLTTAFLFISKSGNTIETLALADYLSQTLKQQGFSLADRAFAMTESADSSLGSWAQANKIPVLMLSKDIGGRYSVLSPVGMVPAAFDGQKLAKYRAGASRALNQIDLVSSLISQCLMSFERKEWITALWSYDEMGRWAGAWFQQLWAESLAKKTTRSGAAAPRVSTPLSLVGAVDQHSILQQFMEGARDKFVIFMRSESAESGNIPLKSPLFPETAALAGQALGRLLGAEAVATERALHESGVSCLTLKTRTLDEDGLGEFFMTWQMVVAGIGAALEIDPFDQPGVELGKRLAREILAKA